MYGEKKKIKLENEKNKINLHSMKNLTERKETLNESFKPETNRSERNFTHDSKENRENIENDTEKKILKIKNEIEIYFQERKEKLIASMSVDINNYGSTHFMFFDIEYFDNNRRIDFNSSWPNEKTIYRPFQFSLINYYGSICINEWIYYKKDELSFDLNRNYFALMNKIGIDYNATCQISFLEAKINMYMKKAGYLIGFGVNTDVKQMQEILDIDLQKYQILDISKHSRFAKDGLINKTTYPESLKILSQLHLKTEIHKNKGYHDALSDSETVRKLFWLEQNNIVIAALKFKK